MIHYHGLPITPESAALMAIRGGHAFVSFAHPGQLGIVIEACSSFALDNGAFSAWRSGQPVEDWTPYYEWVGELRRVPSCDFAVVPDAIDGTEEDNDELIRDWPWPIDSFGAPVWHLHESLERLERLTVWPRVCIGSSGAFATIGTTAWWSRMSEAMRVVCDDTGRPRCKLHGLRMLNPSVFTRFPFASADSTNIGRNVGIDQHWHGTYTPPTKEARALLTRQRIEAYNAPPVWGFPLLEQKGLGL